MNLKNRWLALLACITFAAGMSLAACGDDSRSSSGGSGNNSGTNSQQTQGDDEESSFDVEIEDDQGQSSTQTGKQANEDASESSWGAVINNGILQLLLVSEGGISISVIVETTESLEAPGSFALSEPPDGSHVVLTDLGTMEVFESGSVGSIRLNNCPAAVGDKVLGSFEGVVLNSVMDSGTRTLNGDFDVAVYSVLGSLHCQEQPEETNGNGANSNQSTNQCNYEVCDPEGACCPYASCMHQCDMDCIFQDPACGMGMDPIACAQCFESCYINECNISNECVDAFDDGNACAEQHGCDDDSLSEEEELECMETHCCAELKAVF